MPDEEPTTQQAAAAQAPATATLAYDHVAEEEPWEQEPQELPRRPRRRLLAPVPLALIAALLTACGFIGGVLVEKGQSSSSTAAGATGSGASLLSRLAALRGGGSRTGAGSGVAAASGGSGALGGATAGTVTFVQGSTLYVLTAEGNTVKVTTSPAATVTKTVSSSVKAIHPGETVVVSGSTASNGAVSAEAIRVGGSGESGLGSLFGGAGGASSSKGSTSGGSGSNGGGPALFGPGG